MNAKQNRARQEAAEDQRDGPLPHGRGSEHAGDDQNRAREEAANEPDDVTMADSDVLAYLITFPTYGSWLHGDDRGSVDREHNIPGTALLDPDEARRSRSMRRLSHPPIALNKERRTVVHRTIVEVAQHRDWTLHALNVRTNHVHLVISASELPEQVMNTLKSWSTRRMVEAGVLPANTRAWVRHGSTRYLWKTEQLEAACRYVCEQQGVDLDGDIGPRRRDGHSLTVVVRKARARIGTAPVRKRPMTVPGRKRRTIRETGHSLTVVVRKARATIRVASVRKRGRLLYYAVTGAVRATPR